MPMTRETSPRGYFARLATVISETAATDAAGHRLDLDDAIATCVRMVVTVRERGGTVFCVGNGGSAAIASHACNDLFKTARVRSQSLTEVPLLTAFANDEGYENVYAKPLALMAMPGDLLFAISSSGKSRNILEAVSTFRQRNGRVVTLSGFDPANPLRLTGDLNLHVPAAEYGFVELAHASLLHCVTDLAADRS